MNKKDRIQKYLLQNPIPEKYYGNFQINYCQSYDIELSDLKLWPLISGSSELTRLPELKRMTLEEKNGKIYGKGKLFFLQHEWEELPWQWEYCKEIKTSRDYTIGVVSFVRTHYILSRKDENISSLTIYQSWIPRNFAGYLILKFACRIFWKKFDQTLNEFKSRHNSIINFNNAESLDKYAISNASDVYKKNEDKLNPVRDFLVNHGIEISTIYRILNYIIHTKNYNLQRIRPVILSRILNIDRDATISALLLACKCGLLEISWDIVCPHCRGVKKKYSHLCDIHGPASCGICEIEFSAFDKNIIEITFNVKPEIRKIEQIFYWYAEPSKKPHILLQLNLKRGNTYSFIIPAIEGKLRFRTRGSKSCGTLEVDSRAAVKNVYWDDLHSGLALRCSPGSTVFINNTEKDSELYIIETGEDDLSSLHLSSLFNFYEFRHFFNYESPSGDISIDIGDQNFMIMELVTTSDYLKNADDSGYFKTISSNISLLDDTLKTYNGIIIKTSGNTVIMSFRDPVDAFKCSIKLTQIFDGSKPGIPFSSRITLNRGPCLAVNLDTPVDYFGICMFNTLKLLRYTEPGEICITENFTSESSVSRYITEKKYLLKNTHRAVINGEYEIRFTKIKIKKLPV